jgi:hypothetical protein
MGKRKWANASLPVDNLGQLLVRGRGSQRGGSAGTATGGRQGLRNPGQLKEGSSDQPAGVRDATLSFVANAARRQGIMLPVQATETLRRGDCKEVQSQRQGTPLPKACICDQNIAGGLPVAAGWNELVSI